MKTFNLLVAFALRRRWRFARALAYFPRSTNPEGKQGTAGSLYLLWALKVHLMETPPFWITHNVISSDLKTLAGGLHWLKNLAWLIFSIDRGGSRIFFRRGCTRLLLYFNTNKPHSFFLGRIPVVLENGRSSQGGGGAHPCTLPLDPPLVLSFLVKIRTCQGS